MNTGLHSVCHTLCVSWSHMARLPDLGKLVSSSGTSSSSGPLCVPALFFPYLYFPRGDIYTGSELRRCGTDDGKDKRDLCEGPPRWSRGSVVGGGGLWKLQWWQGDDHGWRVWNNARLTHSAVNELLVSSLFFFLPPLFSSSFWVIIPFSQNPPRM